MSAWFFGNRLAKLWCPLAWLEVSYKASGRRNVPYKHFLHTIYYVLTLVHHLWCNSLALIFWEWPASLTYYYNINYRGFYRYAGLYSSYIFLNIWHASGAWSCLVCLFWEQADWFSWFAYKAFRKREFYGYEAFYVVPYFILKVQKVQFYGQLVEDLNCNLTCLPNLYCVH